MSRWVTIDFSQRKGYKGRTMTVQAMRCMRSPRGLPRAEDARGIIVAPAGSPEGTCGAAAIATAPSAAGRRPHVRVQPRSLRLVDTPQVSVPDCRATRGVRSSASRRRCRLRDRLMTSNRDRPGTLMREIAAALEMSRSAPMATVAHLIAVAATGPEIAGACIPAPWPAEGSPTTGATWEPPTMLCTETVIAPTKENRPWTSSNDNATGRSTFLMNVKSATPHSSNRFRHHDQKA